MVFPTVSKDEAEITSLGIFMVTLFATAILSTMVVKSVFYSSLPEGKPVWLPLFGISVGVVAGMFSSVILYNVLRRELRGCGCYLYADTDYERVGREYEWRRSRDGAKVTWTKHQSQMRRCENCGKHYHVDDVRVVETREAWLEEEPEILPDEATAEGTEL